MNHQQKAIQLVETIFMTVHARHTTYTFEAALKANAPQIKECKICASVTVDEIIEALQTTTGHCTLRKLDWQEVQHDFEYWNRVKTEIENLKN